MPILEKLSQPSQARHWTDSIPLEYHYTMGVAGEEFRRELRDNGRFLVSKCPKCKSTYVPARMYCPDCFIEMKDQYPIDKAGYVYSFTTVNRGRAGEEAMLPSTIALVKFDGVKGGIIHILDVDDPDQVSIGMKVAPSLKTLPQRTGTLTDILSFKPISQQSKPTSEAKATRPSFAGREEQARSLLRVIEESGVPIDVDDMTISSLKRKIGKGELLTRDEDYLLHRLGERAKEWRKAVRSSSETAPEDTLSG